MLPAQDSCGSTVRSPCPMTSSESAGDSSPSSCRDKAKWLDTEEVATPEREFNDTVLHCMSPSSSSAPPLTPGAESGVKRDRRDVMQDRISDLADRATDIYRRYMAKPTFAIVSRAARWPCLCIMVQFILLGIIIVVGILAHPIVVDMDFASFLKTDVQSSIVFEAFWAAERAKPKFASRRLQQTVASLSLPPVYGPPFDLYIMYELKGGQRVTDLLSVKALRDIANLERSLRSRPAWRELCDLSGKDYRYFCNPGISFPGYVLPTMTLDHLGVTPQRLDLDGHGWDPIPQDTTFGLLAQHKFTNLLLPTNYIKELAAAEGRPGSKLGVLRSAFRFRLPVGTARDSDAQKSIEVRKNKQVWSKFAKDLISELQDSASSEFLNMYYDGTDFNDLQIEQALASDMRLCSGSIVTVFAYVLFHTRSLLLTIIGIAVCLLSVPLAYVVCAMITGSTTVNFTAFLAVFLAVGLGCDVIFVYSDFWIESGKRHEDYASRLSWTYTHAGRASFVTTATTALSFFANLASVIRALRQFGFFMGLCVMLAWVLISTIYPPLCILDERIQLCRLRGGEVENLGRRRARLLTRMVAAIERWRRTIVSICCFLLIGGLGLSVVMVKPGEDVPALFPEDHNAVAGGVVLKNFEAPSRTAFQPSSLKPPGPVNVCGVVFNSTGPKGCNLYWCEDQTLLEPKAASQDPIVFDNHCTCHRKARASCSPSIGAKTADVVIRVSSSKDLATRLRQGFDYNTFIMHIVDGPSLALNLTNPAHVTTEKPSLVQHEWESGEVKQWSMTEFKATLGRDDLVSASCGWDELCTCGSARPCNLGDNGWIPAGNLHFPEPVAEASGEGRLLQGAEPSTSTRGSRLLQELALQQVHMERSLQAGWGVARVPTTKRLKVRVVWGLDVDTSVQMLGERPESNMWKYRKEFEASFPWSQRNGYAFCKDLKSNAELRVTRQWCWFDNFRKYLLEKGHRFPVQAYQFDALASSFIKSGQSGTPGLRYVWVVDDTVRAVYTSNQVDVDGSASGSKILEEMAKWDNHVQKYNSKAVDTAKGIFHLSDSWVKAEASSELISSALATLVILLVLSFSFMVTFTWSLALSLFVVMATLSAIAGLTFFIVVCMSWPVALIEVIAIVYFIGYAVTYSLHIAHKYACDKEESPHTIADEHSGPLGRPGAGVGPFDDSELTFGGSFMDLPDDPRASAAIRFHRTKFAITSMGGATIGSAVTTAGASLFLSLATLTIFQRLGTMCLTVTLVSIFIALGPLPASLMMCGPLRPGQGFERILRCCGISGQLLTLGKGSSGSGFSAWEGRTLRLSQYEREDSRATADFSANGGFTSANSSEAGSTSGIPEPKGVGKVAIHSVPQPSQGTVPRRE